MDGRDDVGLVAAVEAVRRDVDATMGEGAVRFEIPPRREGADAWIVVPGVTPTAVGVCTHPGEPPDQLTVRVADTVQDGISESHRYWATGWPTCPLHPRTHQPLVPRSVGGVAVWVCSVLDEVVATIGALAPLDRHDDGR